MTGAVQVFVWLGIIYFTLQITSFVLREIRAYQLKKSIREIGMQRMKNMEDKDNVD